MTDEEIPALLPRIASVSAQTDANLQRLVTVLRGLGVTWARIGAALQSPVSPPGSGEEIAAGHLLTLGSVRSGGALSANSRHPQHPAGNADCGLLGHPAGRCYIKQSHDHLTGKSLFRACSVIAGDAIRPLHARVPAAE